MKTIIAFSAVLSLVFGACFVTGLHAEDEGDCVPIQDYNGTWVLPNTAKWCPDIPLNPSEDSAIKPDGGSDGGE